MGGNKTADARQSTQNLMGIKDISDYSIQTPHGELVLFIIKPTNISVLSEDSISARIYALMNVLKGMAEIEMLCLNSRENFDDNKRNLKERVEKEDNHIIRKLLESDMTYLDRIQVQMATAWEFLILIRLRNEKEKEIFPYLNRIEKSLKEQGFAVSRAGKEDIKRICAVYFEQYTYFRKKKTNRTLERFANGKSNRPHHPSRRCLSVAFLFSRDNKECLQCALSSYLQLKQDVPTSKVMGFTRFFRGRL